MEENQIINHVIFGGGDELNYSDIYTTITFERQIKLILHGL